MAKSIENISGSINLLKLQNSAVVTLKGKTATKRCIVIPIDENDIYISSDESNQAKAAYLGVDIYARREGENNKGQTHYSKQSFSKKFLETLTPEDLEIHKKIYLGNFRPKEFENNNASSEVEAPVVEAAADDLPF